MARFGLLGETLGHSYSPQIHRLLAGYDYDLCPQPPEAVTAFVLHGGYAGLNVTIPYKKTVAALCSALSPAAQRLGSVNTVLRRADGSLFGDNTDYAGFAWLLRRAGFCPAGWKCLVLGSGGASVTIRAVLADQGAAEVVTVSRSGPDNYANLSRHADARLIVNTTPVGMYPQTDAAPLSLEGFPALRGVVDIVYNPARTRLLQQAEALGIPHAGGLGMLVAQARRSAEQFTGQTIPDEAVARVTAQIDGQERNLLLIGMPGAGKSTTGRRLAAALGRPFVDLDEELVRRAGRSIPDIFAQQGEGAFRALETAVLADVARGSGLVIAAGGGVVTRPENRFYLRQNSRVIYLRRQNVDTLSTAGRPVSQSRPLRQLAAERLPLYEQWSDCTVDACGVQRTVAQIRKELNL